MQKWHGRTSYCRRNLSFISRCRRGLEDVIGEFFIREHGQRGALSSGNQLRGFLDSKVRVLADDGHDHADHDLQAADLLRLLLNFIPGLRIFQGALFARSARLLASSLMN